MQKIFKAHIFNRFKGVYLTLKRYCLGKKYCPTIIFLKPKLPHDPSPTIPWIEIEAFRSDLSKMIMYLMQRILLQNRYCSPFQLGFKSGDYNYNLITIIRKKSPLKKLHNLNIFSKLKFYKRVDLEAIDFVKQIKTLKHCMCRPL